MNITPYSASDAFNIADYPALKLFLPCNEGAGNSLIDAVSNQAIATGIALDWSVANAVKIIAGSTAINLPLPTPIPVGTAPALFFAVFNTGLLSTLSLTGANNSIFSFSSGISVGDSAAVVSLGSTIEGEVHGYGIQFTAGTANEGTLYNATNTVWASPTVASASPGDLTTMPDMTLANLGSTFGDLVLYMAGFMTPAVFPADIKAALSWMTASALAGDKRPYPGWKGLA